VNPPFLAHRALRPYLGHIVRARLATSVSFLVLAGLVPAALAAHGGSHDPSPSAPDCEWYGSVQHEWHQPPYENGGTTTEYRERGSGWSGPSHDSSCRGTLDYSYTYHATDGDLWFHREAEGTVSATYEAGWTSGGLPGNFSAGFVGDEPVTMTVTDSSGGEATEDKPASTQGACVVPGADTAAKRARLQAVVITCSQFDESGSPSGQIHTATIRMRRTQCDTSIDTDGDDLADCTEFSLQTEPHNPDTDGDALTDGREVHTYGTDPRDPDTDDGGIKDGDEAARGTDPLDGTDDFRQASTCADGADNDSDGAIDFGSDPGCASAQDASELGDTACDNGIDDDGDGFVDVGGGDPDCEGPQDDDEAVKCDVGFLAGEWAGGTTLNSFVFHEERGAAGKDVSYGLAVRWCVPPTGSPRIVTADIRLDEDRGTSSLSGRLGRTLNELGLGFKVKWKAGSTDQIRSETINGLDPGLEGALRVTAQTGHFDVCFTPLNALAVIDKPLKLFKYLPKRTREKLADRFVRKPAAKAISKYFERKRKAYKKAWLAAVVRDTERARATKTPKRKLSPNDNPNATANQRAKALADETVKARTQAAKSLVKWFVGRMVDLAFKDFCTQVWKPKVVLTIRRSGVATITEEGPSRIGLWSVDELN
jgi:hypothetical protein